MVFGVPSSPSMEALRKEVGNSLTWDSSSKVSRSLSKWKQIATHVLVSLLTASICWLYFTNSSTLTNKALAPASKLLHCGNSTAEARALGCEFDPLTVAWIPEPCINHQITKEFIAEYPWEAFSDRTSNELIVKDQMSEYLTPKYYYTTGREHAIHCLFSFLKLHQGYMGHTGGMYIDSESANYMHTKHCVGVVKRAIDSDPSKLENLQTRNTVALLTCTVET